MAKDINNVTDDISLVMREVIDATENAIVLETALQLHKGSNTDSTRDYIKKQQSTKKQFSKKLDNVSNKAKQFMFNVADNIGAYTGTNTSDIKKEINKGMKMLVRSAKDMQGQTLKKVSRLERYATSANYVPNIDKSIIETTKMGVDKGMPVTYKNGRKVSYKAYMEMAVRTGIQQEIGNRQLETGANANIVFWIVNEFDDCADDHAQYQGKIYYDERFNDFPLRDNIKDAIRAFIKSRQLVSIQSVRDQAPYLTTRPNCRHKMKPVAIDQVLQESLDNIKDSLNLRQASYRPENYDLTKQQRYNERQIRTYKQREQTFRELFKQTNNKDYLLQAQKEKRKLQLWQKRQREFLKQNPQLFRDYERESTKVLLQDLGLTKKKIQVDPNLPPTPIAGTPPQQPPSQDIQMNDVVKEHLEIPDQNLDMFEEENAPLHEVYTGRNLLEERNIEPEVDANDDTFLYDIKEQIQEQKFNSIPEIKPREDFFKEIEESPYVLFRGYGSRGITKANEFRLDMEIGNFYVDNSGGAVHGRGMYFAYAQAGEVKSKYSGPFGMAYAANTALEYSERDGNTNTKIDIAYIRKGAKIGKADDISKEYTIMYREKTAKNKGLEKKHKEYYSIHKKYQNKIDLIDKEFDDLQNKIDELREKERQESIKEEADKLEQEIFKLNSKFTPLYNEKSSLKRQRDGDENEYLYENNDLKELYAETDQVTSYIDVGVAATQLGYDGYETGASNYFVLLNRSQLVLLDNKGNSKDPVLKKIENMETDLI